MSSSNHEDIYLKLKRLRSVGFANIERSVELPSRKEGLGTHDWGPFGRYEFLGAGTPWEAKHARGIKPRNVIDEMAYRHDRDYVRSGKRLEEAGKMGVPARVFTSMERGLYDYGAGAAMMTAAWNPFERLSGKDRVLGHAAGAALMVQGSLRLNPATALPMALIDWMFY